MKKLFFLLLCMFSATGAFAQGYNYLTFTTAQGERSMISEGLVITFSNGKLIAQNALETYEFNISDLSKFFFSETATDVKQITPVESGEVVVYNMSGQFVGRYANASTLNQSLRKGIYVVKAKDKTQKLIVK